MADRQLRPTTDAKRVRKHLAAAKAAYLKAHMHAKAAAGLNPPPETEDPHAVR